MFIRVLPVQNLKYLFVLLTFPESPLLLKHPLGPFYMILRILKTFVVLILSWQEGWTVVLIKNLSQHVHSQTLPKNMRHLSFGFALSVWHSLKYFIHWRSMDYTLNISEYLGHFSVISSLNRFYCGFDLFRPCKFACYECFRAWAGNGNQFLSKLPFDSENLYTDLYYSHKSSTVGKNAVGVFIKWKKAEREGNPDIICLSVWGDFKKIQRKKEIKYCMLEKINWKQLNSRNI